MQLHEDKIRCGSLAGGILSLVAAGAALPTLFLTWWDHGSPKELFNLEDAPPVSASIWTFTFHNPEDWVIYPVAREPSSWDEYCKRDQERQQAGQDANTAGSDSDDEAEEESVGNVSNSSNATLSSADGVVTTSSIFSETSWTDDPSLPGGTCEVIRLIRTMSMVSASCGAAGFAFFLGSRLFMSLTLMLAGAALSAFCAGGTGAVMVLASLLGMTGLVGSMSSICSVLAIVLGISAASVGTWAATKAVQSWEDRQVPLTSQGGEAEEDSDDERVVRRKQFLEDNPYGGKIEVLPIVDTSKSRLVRMRQAERRELRKKEKALKMAKAALAVRKMSDTKRGRGEPTSRQQKIIEQLIADAVPQSLTKILHWGEGRNEGGRNGREIPDDLLKKAFAEIDNDSSGEVTLEELMDACGRCGLAPARGAFESLLLEVDKDHSGDIDCYEFIRFFRTLEDALKEEDTRVNQEQNCSTICACCLMVHIVFLALMVIMAAAQDPDEEEELGPVKQAERDLVDSMIRVIMVTFVMLFWCVIGIPMLKLTVGASSEAWWMYGKDQFAEWRERRRERQHGHHAPEEGEDEDEEAEEKEERHDRETKVNKKTTRSTKKKKTMVKKSKRVPKMTVVDEDDEDVEAGRGTTMDTEMSHASSTASRSGTASSAASRSATPHSGDDHTIRASSKDADDDHAHAKKKARSTKVSRAKSEEGPWWKRMTSIGSGSSPKGRGNRKSPTKKSPSSASSGWQPDIEGQYNPNHFQAANMRAAENLVQPVSTFTPMQVRNVMYQPPDNTTMPLPPAEVQATLTLPGTPDRYGRSYLYNPSVTLHPSQSLSITKVAT